jgi:hypothetical protein
VFPAETDVNKDINSPNTGLVSVAVTEITIKSGRKENNYREFYNLFRNTIGILLGFPFPSSSGLIGSMMLSDASKFLFVCYSTLQTFIKLSRASNTKSNFIQIKNTKITISQQSRKNGKLSPQPSASVSILDRKADALLFFDSAEIFG